MTLNDGAIRRLIASQNLIQSPAPINIQNCGCILTAGTAFSPDTGHEVSLEPGSNASARFWELLPQETLILMTREVVKTTDKLCASYGPLQRNARKGLMLLNPAVVEPYYDGPLSCFLVNFSSQRVQIAPGEPLSKIIFHQLSAPPQQPAPVHFDDDTYKTSLSKAATLFHRSFLDVTGVENRAAAKARQGLKGWAIGTGLFLGLLVLFSTLEPLTSRFILERTGIVTTTQRTADAKLLERIERNLALLQEQNEVRNELNNLKDQLATALREIEAMRNSR